MKTWMLALILASGSAGLLAVNVGCMSAERAKQTSQELKQAADAAQSLPIPSPWKDVAAGVLNLASLLFGAYAAHAAKDANNKASAAHTRLDDQSVPSSAKVKNGNGNGS
jgi:formate hydrogenlyase subunit 3/multisubunit Na+/H+ antiporter MnhD subunit